MSIPLGFDEITLWLAVTSTILLITSEVLSPYYGKIQIFIDKKRIRNTAFIVSIIFLIMVVVRVIGIVLA